MDSIQHTDKYKKQLKQLQEESKLMAKKHLKLHKEAVLKHKHDLKKNTAKEKKYKKKIQDFIEAKAKAVKKETKERNHKKNKLIKVTKTITIKVPKNAELNLKVRHGKLTRLK